MTCDVCGGELPADQHVAVDGGGGAVNAHAVGCFRRALLRMQFKVAAITVLCDSSMKPATAFKAGETFVATIVASRRRTKKKDTTAPTA